MSIAVDQVFSALDEVVDPCSVGAGAPLSVREMGLVQDVTVTDQGQVLIVLRLSSPGCLMGGFYFEPQIAKRVGAIPGVASVVVTFGDPMTWSEADISEQGRLKLAAARNRKSAR